MNYRNKQDAIEAIIHMADFLTPRQADFLAECVWPSGIVTAAQRWNGEYQCGPVFKNPVLIANISERGYGGDTVVLMDDGDGKNIAVIYFADDLDLHAATGLYDCSLYFKGDLETVETWFEHMRFEYIQEY